MALITLAEEAIERSTYVVTLSFSDEEGVPVAPSSLTWTLTDASGAVVNERAAVSITPAVTVNVILTDEDLAMLGGMDTGDRYLLVEGEYTSNLGSGLALRDEVKFSVRNLVKVT
jgi:hypothetical protein